MFFRPRFHSGDIKKFSVFGVLAHSNFKIMSKFSTVNRTESSFFGSPLEFNRSYSLLEELIIKSLIKIFLTCPMEMI